VSVEERAGRRFKTPPGPDTGESILGDRHGHGRCARPAPAAAAFRFIFR